jgi:hypothetical protein
MEDSDYLRGHCLICKGNFTYHKRADSVVCDCAPVTSATGVNGHHATDPQTLDAETAPAVETKTAPDTKPAGEGDPDQEREEGAEAAGKVESPDPEVAAYIQAHELEQIADDLFEAPCSCGARCHLNARNKKWRCGSCGRRGEFRDLPPAPSPQKSQPDNPGEPQPQPSATEVPRNEHLGRVYFHQLTSYIDRLQGRYIRDEFGRYWLIASGVKTSLTPGPDNQKLAFLMHLACNVSTQSPAARAAIERLQVEAARKAGRTRLKRFSALSPDGSRLYVPNRDGKLLLISADEISSAPNGDNQDHFWVEHPYGDPLQYSPCDVVAGLGHFERLLVETQACTIPAMRWFVGMHAGYFPFIRALCLACFLLVFIARTQSGKTSGAQRFTLLHGLGPVKGDFSVAALNSLGDIGLLVMDNREQNNFTQPLIDYCLFLATGAEFGRAQVDGQLRASPSGRPVGIITTIEGVVKAELHARCVEIPYEVNGQRLRREPIEREISQLRHEIGSAMMQVLVRFFQIRGQHRPTPNPLPNFEEHFTALCDLLRAFGEVAGKPEGWSEALIQEWNTVLVNGEPEEDDLEHPILRVLNECETEQLGPLSRQPFFAYQGVNGSLYVTTAQDLLTFLQKLNLRNLRLPNAQGLSRRLNSSKFRSFTFLPTDTVPEVKRSANRRPIGFFRPESTELPV